MSALRVSGWPELDVHGMRESSKAQECCIIMKRWIVTFTVLVLVGAIVNVAVAWGMDIARQPTRAALAAPGAMPMPPTLWQSGSGGFFQIAPRHLPGWHVSGWPCDALLRRDRPADANATEYQLWRDGLTFKLWAGNPLDRDLIEVAVLPTLSGFWINTAFYAALLWLMLAAPGGVKRWRRVRRGLCAGCGYPVGESATCTECGGAVAFKRGAAL